MGFEQDALDASFRGPIGRDASYTPSGGSSVDIRVIPVLADVEVSIFGVDSLSDAQVFDVRVSEVATPARGDTIRYDDLDYTINADPARADRLRLVWRLQGSPS